MPVTASITAQDILDEIKPLGADGYKRVLMNHGIREPLYGVKIEYLKKIQKRVGKNHQLALDLFDTGIYDAMYLAGLIADDLQMTKQDLKRWIAKANSSALCASTVAWVAAGSNHGHALALQWIESETEDIATTGWCTLSGLVALKEDSELDLKEIQRLLERVAKTIHDQPNRVRYAMNGFVIAVGSYVRSLTADAIAIAKKIGKVSVDMGNTACKVPDAAAYINKVKQRGAIGKKRKSVKC
ncbi:MAG: alkylation repair protein [Phycisphaerales bacterium]|nr:alkylation repair protein [Phycisphaerales bacterium]